MHQQRWDACYLCLCFIFLITFLLTFLPPFVLLFRDHLACLVSSSSSEPPADRNASASVLFCFGGEPLGEMDSSFVFDNFILFCLTFFFHWLSNIRSVRFQQDVYSACQPVCQDPKGLISTSVKMQQSTMGKALANKVSFVVVFFFQN